MCVNSKKLTVFLSAAGTYQIIPIRYGVTINILPSPMPTDDIPNNVTNSTSKPTAPPSSDHMPINYTVYFKDDKSTDMKFFFGRTYDLTESMKPCTNYSFTVITTINGTSCLMRTSHITTLHLGKLFFCTKLFRIVYNTMFCNKFYHDFIGLVMKKERQRMKYKCGWENLTCMTFFHFSFIHLYSCVQERMIFSLHGMNRKKRCVLKVHGI